MPGVRGARHGRRSRARRRAADSELVRLHVAPTAAPTTTPLHHALAVDTVRFVGEAVVAVIAATPLQARDAAERIESTTSQLPAVVDTVAAASARRAERSLSMRRTTSPARPATAIPLQPRRRSRAPPTSCALDLVNQRVAAVSDRAALDARDATTTATGRLTLRVSCQTPTGLRDELCDAVLGIPKDKRARGRRRRRRRLRHEDERCIRRTSSSHSPRASSSKPVRFTRRAHRGIPRRKSRPRRQQHRPSSRSTATAAILALRVASLANVGAYATPAGVVIQLMIGPWVSTSIYDIATIDIGIRRC